MRKNNISNLVHSKINYKRHIVFVPNLLSDKNDIGKNFKVCVIRSAPNHIRIV